MPWLSLSALVPESALQPDYEPRPHFLTLRHLTCPDLQLAGPFGRTNPFSADIQFKHYRCFVKRPPGRYYIHF